MNYIGRTKKWGNSYLILQDISVCLFSYGGRKRKEKYSDDFKYFGKSLSLMAMTERPVFFLLCVLYMQLLTMDAVSQFPAFRWTNILKGPPYPPPSTLYPAPLQLPMCTTACDATLTKSEGIQVKNSSAGGLFSAVRLRLCSCKQLLCIAGEGKLQRKSRTTQPEVGRSSRWQPPVAGWTLLH